MLALEVLYQLHYISMKSLECIYLLVFVVVYEFSGLDKVLNIW